MVLLSSAAVASAVHACSGCQELDAWEVAMVLLSSAAVASTVQDSSQ